MEVEKFWTKFKLIVLGVIIGIIAIIFGIVMLYRSSMRKKYIMLESQINNSASNYLDIEDIELEKDEYRKIDINLIKEKKLVTNSNIKDCKGYVIAKNSKGKELKEEYDYKTYLACKNIYKTVGYGSETTGTENKTITQTENDTKAPEIKLLGSETMTIAIGEEFKDPGATAYDKVDGDITKKIKAKGEVDVNTIGEYLITYTVSDKAGNSASKERKVIVKEGEIEDGKDTNPPVITFINPNSYQKVCLGDKVDISTTGTYGFTAYDDKDGNITSSVVISGDTGLQSKTGTYTINYSVFDQAKNATTASRTYSVVDCRQPDPTPTPTPTPSGGGNSGGNSGGGSSGGSGGGSSSSSSSSSGGTTRPDVNITVNVTSISCVDSITLNVGASQNLNASVLPSNATNKTLSYRSLNAGVASVDGNGTVRGVSRGETRIIITSSNNVQKAVYIVVK
ncbi:MAG: DUF5011 domain-containing protein [Bacilli bacterium]|nr:DUF5011 domain-containing protein [Bacilli bacterium]